jgi:photosystem II stability/assembly factor-like uncharacterized protein
MYVCLSPAAFSQDGSLYRSNDLAKTWRRIDHGIKAQSTLMAVSVHSGDPDRIYCVTRGGQVFGTEDAGGSWREYSLPRGGRGRLRHSLSLRAGQAAHSRAGRAY